MSLATWKKEFYPIPANEVKNKDALDHSIKKWTGLLPRNRKKHGVKLSGCEEITDGKHSLDIDTSSCALCTYHICHCPGCPAYECFRAYDDFCDSGSVRPMLSHLLKAKK